MEAVAAASAIVGLAVPVFQCAKALRDRIKLVRDRTYLLRVQRTHSASALAGRIRESGTLGSPCRIRKGHQSPRVALQRTQDATGSSPPRQRFEGARTVRMILFSRS